jgi:hypothetical protein
MTPIEQDKFIVWLKRYPRIGADPENPAITEANAISQTLQDAFIKLQQEGIDVMGMFGERLGHGQKREEDHKKALAEWRDVKFFKH